MSEKTRFHNMTKPIKFRRLKIVKNYIVLWCKALRERIIYLSNYILYKLHILERYSYRDNTERVVPLPHEIRERGITSQHFKGVVKSNLVIQTDIDLNYFYKRQKDGSKKITLYLSKQEESRMYLVSHLKDIGMKFDDKWYDVSSLPVFKMALFDTVRPVSFGDVPEDISVPEFKTVNFNIRTLKNMRYKSFIGMIDDESKVSTSMLKYYYDLACSEFTKSLGELTPQDLMF